jgi:hypothetical protein
MTRQFFSFLPAFLQANAMLQKRTMRTNRARLWNAGGFEPIFLGRKKKFRTILRLFAARNAGDGPAGHTEARPAESPGPLPSTWIRK